MINILLKTRMHIYFELYTGGWNKTENVEGFDRHHQWTYQAVTLTVIARGAR